MYYHTRSPMVVIISRDWRSRALLRALLLEEGVRLKAYLSVTGVKTLDSGTHPPALVVADLSASENDLEALSALAGRIPVWVIASRALTPEAADVRERGFEAVFYRPVRLGDLAACVKQRVSDIGHNNSIVPPTPGTRGKPTERARKLSSSLPGALIQPLQGRPT